MTLRMYVQDGQLLNSTDIGSKMENYVSVKLQKDPEIGEREFRTKIVQGAAKTKKEENRITFNDVLEIPVANENARLYVRIMDEDMTDDDVCAEGYVNLKQCKCFSGQPRQFTLQLHEPPKKGKQPEGGKGGELRFSIQYV